MAADINVAGLVFGTIFGALFLLTCVISAVKAVKDRKKIKERIESKRRQRLESSAYDNPQNDTFQHLQINGTPVTSVKKKTKSVTTSEQNVCVHNFVPRTHSSEGIPGERQRLKQSYSTPTSSVPNAYPLTRTSDPNLLEINHYPAETIIASRNILRRMSYDVAVEQFSWLNHGPPTYASSNTISNVYSYLEPGPVVVFDNKAYDSENQI